MRFRWEILGQTDGTMVSLTADVSGWLAVLLKRKVEQTLTDDLFTWLYALKTTLERDEKAEISKEHSITKPKKRRHIPGPLGFLFKKDEDE